MSADDDMLKLETIAVIDSPLPCPFCGGNAPYLQSALRDGYEDCPDDPDARSFIYVCHSCACQGGWAKSASNALRCWNMRTETTP